jgi:hypothetical protein
VRTHLWYEDTYIEDTYIAAEGKRTHLWYEDTYIEDTYMVHLQKKQPKCP